MLFRSGTDGNFDFVELRDWSELSTGWLDTFNNSFGTEGQPFGKMELLGTGSWQVPALIWGPALNRKVALVVHPLWDVSATGEDSWLTEILGKAQGFITGNGTVQYLDSFNLARRPGRCYEWLMDTGTGAGQ